MFSICPDREVRLRPNMSSLRRLLHPPEGIRHVFFPGGRANAGEVHRGQVSHGVTIAGVGGFGEEPTGTKNQETRNALRNQPQ
jgi:hypothetical protein